MAGPSRAKNGVKAIGTAEKQRRALDLRKAGATLDQIASSLGYASAAGAAKAVNTAIHKIIQEPADEVRMLELSRLDAMLFAIWSKVKAGNEGAIDRALKIMDRRAKLLGLDAPLKVNISQLVQDAADQFGLTPDELAKLHSDVEAFIQTSKAAAE